MWFARRVTVPNQLYAATSQQIWRRQSLSWVGIVPAGITVSAVSRWQWAQVGDVTLAGSKETQPLQIEAGSTTATTLTTMPRYAVIDTVGEFVMIGNVQTSVTYSQGGAAVVNPGDHPDRWWSSARGNYADYNPSIATQAATGRLLDVPGGLTAGKQLGERFVFYKQRGMWVGTYEGPPFIWGWALATQEVGTFGQQCVVPVNYVHYFVGNDNFYVFDGAQVRPIGEGVREWFFGRMNKSYADKIWGVHDEYNSLVYWWYPTDSARLNDFVVYNYEVGKWGVGELGMQAASAYFVDDLTWDQLWQGLTFDAIPDTTFDSAYFQANSFVPVFIDDTKRLSTQLGPHLDSSLQTTFGGDDAKTSLLRRVRIRWITAPTTATLTPSRVMQQGDTPQPGNTVTMRNARFDFTQNARWHRALIQTEGNWESPGIDAELVNRGRE